MPALVVALKPVHRSEIAATKRHLHRRDTQTWSTSHVDPERSRYNVTLIGSGDVERDINADINGIEMSRKARTPGRDVVACEVVISVGKPFFGLQKDTSLTVEDCERLQKDTDFRHWLAVLVSALKAEGCIAAELHLDETTLHVHATMSCRTQNRRKGKDSRTGKQSKSKRCRSTKGDVVLAYEPLYGMPRGLYKLGTASKEKREKMEKQPEYQKVLKEYGMGEHYDSTKTPAGKFQTRLWEAIGKPFGLTRGEAASTTNKKGMTVKEWRIQQADKKLNDEIKAHQQENAQKIKEIKSQSFTNLPKFKDSCDKINKSLGDSEENMTALVDIIEHIQTSTERFAAKHHLNIESFSRKMQAALAKAEKARSEEKKIRAAGDDALAAMAAGMAAAFKKEADPEERRLSASEAEAEAAKAEPPIIDETPGVAEGFERWREKRKTAAIYKNMNNQAIQHHNM